MNIITLTVGALETNCYLVACPETPAPSGGRGLEAAVIDPGGDAPRILAAIRSLGEPGPKTSPNLRTGALRVEVKWIINTHGHADHLAANTALKAAFPDARLAVHEADAQMLVDAELNLSDAFGMGITSPPADVFLHDGDEISFGSTRLQVIHVPGHTPGGIALYAAAGKAAQHSAFGNGQSAFTCPVLFSGDALFQGGIGRSDFPGGSGDQLIRAIRARLLTLPAETEVFPGHGGRTTIGKEARSNPFLT